MWAGIIAEGANDEPSGAATVDLPGPHGYLRAVFGVNYLSASAFNWIFFAFLATSSPSLFFGRRNFFSGSTAVSNQSLVFPTRGGKVIKLEIHRSYPIGPCFLQSPLLYYVMLSAY